MSPLLGPLCIRVGKKSSQTHSDTHTYTHIHIYAVGLPGRPVSNDPGPTHTPYFAPHRSKAKPSQAKPRPEGRKGSGPVELFGPALPTFDCTMFCCICAHQACKSWSVQLVATRLKNLPFNHPQLIHVMITHPR